MHSHSRKEARVKNTQNHPPESKHKRNKIIADVKANIDKRTISNPLTLHLPDICSTFCVLLSLHCWKFNVIFLGCCPNCAWQADTVSWVWLASKAREADVPRLSQWCLMTAKPEVTFNGDLYWCNDHHADQPTEKINGSLEFHAFEVVRICLIQAVLVPAASGQMPGVCSLPDVLCIGSQHQPSGSFQLDMIPWFHWCH